MRLNTNKTKITRALGALLLPAALASQVFAEGPSLSGFVDFGYNYNFNGMAANTLRSFDSKSNSFTLQNAEVVVSGKSDKDVTYRVDLDYGFDATNTNYLNNNAGDELDIQQAFITVPCPLTGGAFTAGKFVTLHGAEVIEAKDNFNTSRGFLFNYAIPLHHTGVKYDKAFGDLALTGAVVNGWDNLYENNKGKTFHGMAAYTFSPKLFASLGGTYGPEQASPTAAGVSTEKNSRGLVDALVKAMPTDKLTLIANWDWGVEEGLTPAGTDTTQNWAGLALHANYMLTDAYSAALRWETFDDEGSRTAALTPAAVNGQVLHSLTATLQHKMNDVITRLEFRQDTSSKKVFVDDKGMPDDSQSTLGVQWIYAF